MKIQYLAMLILSIVGVTLGVIGYGVIFLIAFINGALFFGVVKELFED